MSLSCQGSGGHRRTKRQAAGALSHLRHRLAAALAAGLVHASDIVLLWRERARQRRALQNLNDDQLKDIWISRCEVERESVRWFWWN
jgi:uncharacterized protein YjiS (DUF1127 family)